MTTLVNSQTLEPTFANSLVTVSTTQTLSNKTLKTTREPVALTNTAATGSLNFDVATQTIMLYNTATGNFSINIRGDASTPLNSVLAVGESLGLCLLVPNGSTAYYLTSLSIDGVNQTGRKHQSGIYVTAGNPNSTDMYNIFIIKTAANTYQVYLSLTKYA
jgi:hypothetical protein